MTIKPSTFVQKPRRITIFYSTFSQEWAWPLFVNNTAKALFIILAKFKVQCLRFIHLADKK